MNKYAAQSRASQRARRQRRMCDDKVGFDSPEAARQTGQEFYRCKHCKRYHRTGQLASLLALTRRLAPR